MSHYTLRREITIDEGYDLLVAGGGPAGVSAATCAARLGARVLLAEATGCLGGMGTSGLVNAFDPMADGERMLVGGFMREIVESMHERGFPWSSGHARLLASSIPLLDAVSLRGSEASPR